MKTPFTNWMPEKWQQTTKTLIVSGLLLAASNSVWAQTTIIDPAGDGGFETGADFAANGWTVANYTAVNPNKWFVGTVGVPSQGSRSAYISDNATGTTYHYNTANFSRVMFYRDVVFPAGETFVTLSFKIKGNGEQNYDDLTVFMQNSATVPAVTQPSASSNSAPSISDAANLGTTSLSGTGYVTKTYIISAAVTGNATIATTRRIIFYWENDDGGGSQPPASIDEISLVSALPPAAPANDNASGAIALTVNGDFSCGTTTNGTTISATQSAETAPDCSVSGTNDDVWYTFMATNTDHRISFSNVSSNNMVAALYTGTPGNLTPIAGNCSNGDELDATGLTVNTTYYVRAYTNSGNTATSANFTICVGTQPPPPVNDDCTGAIAIVNDGIVTGDNSSAADDDLTALPSCDVDDDVTEGNGRGVWFTVTPTTSGDMTISTCGTEFDTYLRVYSGGTCGAFATCEGFNDDNENDDCASNTLSSTVVVANAVANTTYYIFMAGYDNGELGAYSLQVSGVSVPLPIKLESFTGKNVGGSNQLSWKTSEEKDFNYFELQRSADGINFSKIMVVNSKKSAIGSTYNYEDKNPVEGKNFYRLNMVDVNSKNTVSNVVLLNSKLTTGLSVTVNPNPVKRQLNLNIAGTMDGKGQVIIINVVGKVVRSLSLSENNGIVDMGDLPSGIYMVKYIDRSHSSIIKVTKE